MTYPDALQAKGQRNTLPCNYICANKGSLEVIQILVEANPDVRTVQAKNGALSLHFICLFHERPGLVKEFVKTCPDVITVEDYNGSFLLNYAGINERHLEVIQLFVWQYCDTPNA